jgi:hypothetical protein
MDEDRLATQIAELAEASLSVNSHAAAVLYTLAGSIKDESLPSLSLMCSAFSKARIRDSERHRAAQTN